MGLSGLIWSLALLAVGLAIIMGAIVVGVAYLKGGLSGLLAKARPADDVDACSYERKETLMTPGEAAFYRVLVRSAGSEFLVMTKVRLGDVVNVCGGTRSTRTTGLNKVQQKHLDFVLLDARDLRILGAVELDDRTHEREDRRERDGFVEEVLGRAGVPLVRVKAAAGYGVEEVGRRVREVCAGVSD